MHAENRQKNKDPTKNSCGAEANLSDELRNGYPVGKGFRSCGVHDENWEMGMWYVARDIKEHNNSIKLYSEPEIKN